MSKYPRTYHLPYSKGCTSDDKITDSVDSLLNITIIITEKMDGSNTAIMNKGVYGRSHGDYTQNAWDRPMWDLWNLIKRDIDDGLYLFGENMYGIHSIEYTKLKSYFYLFGIRSDDVWLSWSTIEEYSYLLNIPTVPVLFKGIVKSDSELRKLVEDLSNQPSALGGLREGIVVRNANEFHNDNFSTNLMKWVRKDHVTTTIHWTRDWKKAKIVQ